MLPSVGALFTAYRSKFGTRCYLSRDFKENSAAVFMY